MDGWKIISASVLTAAIVGLAMLGWGLVDQAPQAAVATPHAVPSPAAEPRGPFRVLHVMSYDSDWAVWTLAQFNAFQRELADLDVEYKVVELDANRDSSPEHLQARLDEARALIAEWKPNLVYASDDLAQDRLVREYIGANLPFVFSGVNRDPAYYGFDKAPNVTGVLEREHILQTVELAKQLLPEAQQMAVITDTGDTWPGVLSRFRQLEPRLPLKIASMDVVETYEAFQRKIRQYEEDGVDVVCTLGIFNFKNAAGQNVPMQDVGRWTYENTKLANISFWDSRPPLGALCVVAVSGRAQGEAAGRIAHGILAEGLTPTDYPIEATSVGRPIINLTVARHLGLMPSSTLLLSSEVIQTLDW